MKLKAVNKKIAAEPFKPVTTTSKVVNGIAMLETKLTLIGLKVVFGGDLAPEGSTIYVMADSANAKWAKEKYTVEGKEFVLVPEEYVLLVAKEEPVYAYTALDNTYKSEF